MTCQTLRCDNAHRRRGSNAEREAQRSGNGRRAPREKDEVDPIPDGNKGRLLDHDRML